MTLEPSGLLSLQRAGLDLARRGCLPDLYRVRSSTIGGRPLSDPLQLALKFHPDKAGGSTQAFHLIKQAYDTLTDTDKRRAYDACRAASPASVFHSATATNDAGSTDRRIS